MDDSRVILVTLTLILLVVEITSVLLGPVLCLLAVVKVHSLGLGQLVGFHACEAGDGFLGELVGDGSCVGEIR